MKAAGSRAIVHFNITDFAVAVERVRDPSLKMRPLIIAPAGSCRATVYDMSEEAYLDGVRKGMSLAQARWRCRGAVILRPDFTLYARAMTALIGKVKCFSPVVQTPDCNGHVFVDLTGGLRLFGKPADTACKIQRVVQDELRFTPAWALASNKLVAKTATRLLKPQGECVVEPGREAAFLASLPLDILPCLSRSDVSRLQQFKFDVVGQVADLSFSQLAVPLGRCSRTVYEAVRGIDNAPVIPDEEPEPCLSLTHTFSEPTTDRRKLDAVLFSLVSETAWTLRSRHMAARRVGIYLRYQDKKTVVRQAACRVGQDKDFQLFSLASKALSLAWLRRVGVSDISVRFDRLVRPSCQMVLFPDAEKKRQTENSLFEAFDTIRNRWGKKSIAFGKEKSGGGMFL